MPSKKAKKICASLILLGVLGLVIFHTVQFCKPQTIQGSLLAQFGGVTNEVGEVLAYLTNSSRWQITYYPRIETKEYGQWPSLPAEFRVDSIAKPRTIAPFTGEFVALAPPTNSGEWRLWMVYTADTERNEKVRQAQSFFRNIGLSGIGSRIKQDHAGYLILPESTESGN